MQIVLGFRFVSETEPELGLGIITQVANKTIQLSFQGGAEIRTYGLNGAPIKRVIFDVGDQVTLNSQPEKKITILTVNINDPIVIYSGKFSSSNLDDENENQMTFSEIELSSFLSFNKPTHRLHYGTVDSPQLFQLRFLLKSKLKNLLNFPLRGFIGGKIRRLPHQYYVANSIGQRTFCRAILADEVGLGKTIEAGLIIHHLLITEKIQRVLIIVPDSLAYQWFIEMYKKFQLSFTTITQETPIENDTNPFHNHELAIVNWGLLRGAELARKLLLSAQFDLVVLDEAHLIQWKKEDVSFEYKLVSQLVKNSEHLLLLSGTPVQKGIEGHFARLQLIDPKRFFSLEEFQNENLHYEDINQQAFHIINNHTLSKEDIQRELNSLIDTHGTSRLFYRNTRKSMEKFQTFFPERRVFPYPLPFEHKKFSYPNVATDQEHNLLFATKEEWLCQWFLKNDFSEKILLISKSKKKILQLEKELALHVPGLKIAVFHSDLSFMARDRQAQYFIDPEGAHILLCTEIGAEGRNFECAKHLVLFDLPANPENLEQRIGRLDRIGQKNSIHIHVPYCLSTYEEILFQWHHAGLECWLHQGLAPQIVFEQKEHLLENFLQHPREVLTNAQAMETFIQETHSDLEIKRLELQKGQDHLIELNSYNHDLALSLIKELNSFEESMDLPSMMFTIFQSLGVDIEDQGQDIYFIKPNDNMFVPIFPELEIDGKSITFNREVGLRRDDVHLITWDHPMVTGILNLITTNSTGNSTIVSRRSSNQNTGKYYLEFYFTLFPFIPKKSQGDRFFPPEIIRILLDNSGEDISEKWDKHFIDEKVFPPTPQDILKAKSISKDTYQKYYVRSLELAKKKAWNIIQKNIDQMKIHILEEKERLCVLKEKNRSINDNEIFAFDERIKTLTLAFEQCEVQLDSVRLIF